MSQNEKRAAVIKAEIFDVYGKGPMATGCAEQLANEWDAWARGEGRAEHQGLHYAVHMCIWNWFAGGTTAEYAATKVVEAVEKLESAAA